MLTNLFSHRLTVSMSMAVVIGAALVLMHLFGKNFAARTRYLVWTILILRLCVPVGTMMISPMVTLEVTPPEIPAEEILPETDAAETMAAEWGMSAAPQMPPEPQTAVWEPVYRENLPPMQIPETEPIRTAETVVVQTYTEPEEIQGKPPVSLSALWNSHILPGICVLWLTVAMGSFFGQLYGYLRLMSSMQRTILVADPETKELYRTICAEMHIGQSYGVRLFPYHGGAAGYAAGFPCPAGNSHP